MYTRSQAVCKAFEPAGPDAVYAELDPRHPVAIGTDVIVRDHVPRINRSGACKCLPESMTVILVDSCRRSRSYASSACAASYHVVERDLACRHLTKESRHSNGGMQDLIAFVKAAVDPVGLAAIDYAGLTTSPKTSWFFIGNQTGCCPGRPLVQLDLG
ncbi:hypothetical protein CLU79DRAFT_892009 [Phycomyces nitens]|nr:hypothetical protein CLU79DRAFT_892009 [Phycomyces nitens]